MVVTAMKIHCNKQKPMIIQTHCPCVPVASAANKFADIASTVPNYDSPTDKWIRFPFRS